MPKAKGNPDYILGGKLNPFTSVTDRDLAMPAGVARRECYMVNPFVSLDVGVYGLVKFIDNGVSWKLAPEQVLADFRNFDGSPIMDISAAALTPGIIAELWASPILPNWMFDSVISFFCDAVRLDAASIASSKLLAGIRIAPLSNDIYTNCLLGTSNNTSALFRGVSALGNTAICVGGVLTGTSAEVQTGNGTRVTIGSYAEGQTKARISFAPGATTNVIRAYSLTIKTGPC